MKFSEKDYSVLIVATHELLLTNMVLCRILLLTALKHVVANEIDQNL